MARLDQLQQQSAGMPGGQPATGADAVINAANQPMNDSFSSAGMGGEATPDEQKNYEQAANMLGKMIYGTKDSTSNKIADSILPDNKAGSVIQTGLTLLNKVDEAVDINPVAIPQLIEDTVKMLTDVAEQKNGVQFSQDEVDGAAMGMFEAIISMVGGDESMEGDFTELTEGMSPEELEQMRQLYQQKLQNVKPAGGGQPPAGGGQPPAGGGQPPAGGGQNVAQQPVSGGQANGQVG